MKYNLGVVRNEKGNEVFAKRRVGKQFLYVARAGNGEIGQVTKEWVIRNQEDILNVGVDINGQIYPIMGYRDAYKKRERQHDETNGVRVI